MHRIHLGATILPFKAEAPLLGVIPWDGQRLLHGGDDRLDLYPGLAQWWRSAEAVWTENSSGMTLLEQIDYRRKLSGQLPAAPHRVVYGKAEDIKSAETRSR